VGTETAPHPAPTAPAAPIAGPADVPGPRESGAPGAATLDAARAREALRALRNAAGPAESTPAPGRATPAGPALAARTALAGGLPRRTLLLVLAVVVIALVGTVIGVAMAHSGGDSKDHGAGAPTAGTPSADARATAKSGKGGETANATDDAATARTSAGASAPAAAPSTAPAGPRPSAAGVPAGWHTYHDTRNGFSIAVPDGWTRVGDNGFGSGSKLAGPGGASLLVDWTDKPGPSALGAWKTSSAKAPNSMKGYQLLRLTGVHYRDYDAADWEYKRLVEGKPVHVLDRGMVTDPKHGYALMYTVPAGQWASAAKQDALKTFFATFKPAK
jgi:hypothetical protein